MLLIKALMFTYSTTSALKWKINKKSIVKIKLTFRWNPICPLISNPFNRIDASNNKKRKKKLNKYMLHLILRPFIMLGT